MINKKILQNHAFKIFLILSISIIAYGYFYPLLKYSYETPNPWPSTYQDIQKSIIDQHKVPPDYVIQFGEKQRSDMTYFLNHHLMMVSFKLFDNLPFEINERFLTVILTLAIFLSAYLFFNKVFGSTRGFLISVLFIFLPRNFNYYINVNGEFLSLIVLFVSLYFILDWISGKNVKSLVVGTILAGILPILCIGTFGMFCLIVFSYFIADLILDYDKRQTIFNYLKLAACFIFFTVILAVAPLYKTGDLIAGGSSSIGSFYTKRPQSEIEAEKKYYEDFASYGSEFIKFPPLIRDFYYISVDGAESNYFIVFYVFIFFIGMMLVWRQRRRKEVLFPVILGTILILIEIFFYSRISNDNIYNTADRLLLYFFLPTVMLGGVALQYLNQKNKMLIWIFILTLSISSITVIDYAAHVGNMRHELYAMPYKEALAFARDYIPADALIMSNDWVNGEFHVQADKLDLTESLKASAQYSTYEHIYGILKDSRDILNPSVGQEETLKLLRNRGIKYVVLWNMPDAYYIYQYDGANKKFSSLPYVEKVFSVSETLIGGFPAVATIYQIKSGQF